jgi:hypothetical protein
VPRHTHRPGHGLSRRDRQRGLSYQEICLIDFEAEAPALYCHHYSKTALQGWLGDSFQQGRQMHQRQHATLNRYHAANGRLDDRHGMHLTQRDDLKDIGQRQTHSAAPSAPGATTALARPK